MGVLTHKVHNYLLPPRYAEVVRRQDSCLA
jgi:hypothetical protein